MMTRTRVLSYAAAATTAVGGILHILLVPNALGFNMNNAIFFLVSGIVQLFWVVPMVRQWPLPWYIAGIAGTGVLIALWVITRMPGNPLTGRAGPINEMSIGLELMQAAFIGLAAAVIVTHSRMKKLSDKSARDSA